MKIVTCIAPINIAVIKYWGKRDEELILPLNDSISTTLDLQHLRTTTTIAADPNFKENKFWLNGKEENFDTIRLQICLNEIRKRAAPELEWLHWNIHICSENNFPTAAGLASSASGFACLVYTLARLYQVDDELSNVARRGSGSACRSMFGGWVRWYMGTKEHGLDSKAEQLFPVNHWPQIRIVILVVNDRPKPYSSTSGMQTTVATSTLLEHRVKNVVPKRIELITKAIEQRNFEEFAELTMRDSNQLHATCLDTYPPCIYMNETSHAIANMVHAYNNIKKSIKLAYTFDAGPNACLYVLDENVPEVMSLINYIFPSTASEDNYLRGLNFEHIKIPKWIQTHTQCQVMPTNQLRYIIHTKIGEGPQLVDDFKAHLLDEQGVRKFISE